MTNPLEFLTVEPEPVAGDGLERRELLIARRGGRLFGVFATDSAGIVEWKEPTPLPNATPAILGLVCVRGRMFTVIDPNLLLPAEPATPPIGFIILLNGPEQLALGVERVSSIAEILAEEIESEMDDGSPRAGSWTDGSQRVTILNIARIFVSACETQT